MKPGGYAATATVLKRAASIIDFMMRAEKGVKVKVWSERGTFEHD
jgi:hypothetical protein